MGSRPKFFLSEDQREQLVAAREIARQQKDHRLSVRIRAILLAGQGDREREEIAQICEVGLTTIYLWQRIYIEDGIDGLKGRYKPRRCALTVEQTEKLKSTLDAGPEAAGLEVGIWTAALAAKMIKRLFGVQYSVSGATRLLKRLGYSVQVPRVQLAKADEEAQRVWLEETFPELRKRAEESGGTLFFRTSAASSRPAQRRARGRGWVREPLSKANPADGQ
jgi:transposase